MRMNAMPINDKNEQLIISDESNDLDWVELSKLAEYNNSESIMRMGRKTGTIT